MTLKGKHALVTGSSRGIGRGIALKLAEKGAHVAVHFYQNEDAAKATLAKIRECGSDGFLVQADGCRPEEVSRIFKQVEKEFGSLDIFVSNARTEAPTFYQPPMEITLDKWDTAVDSQPKAFLVGVREAARLMRDGGRIIAITFAPGGRFIEPVRSFISMLKHHEPACGAVWCLRFALMTQGPRRAICSLPQCSAIV
jgi:NAD(P)-dependent dehydrogenase (short-subunit alcohol dehydrogenase family)